MKRTTRFFKALSDRTRLQILWLISRKGQASLQDIERVLGIPPKRASGHVKYLMNAGVIVNRPDIQGPCYRLMQQTDPFRRATLDGLKDKLCEPAISAALERRLDE
jgi:DNA-binding transcriptional ArsR family regulator